MLYIREDELLQDELLQTTSHSRVNGGSMERDCEWILIEPHTKCNEHWWALVIGKTGLFKTDLQHFEVTTQ